MFFNVECLDFIWQILRLLHKSDILNHLSGSRGEITHMCTHVWWLWNTLRRVDICNFTNFTWGPICLSIFNILKIKYSGSVVNSNWERNVHIQGIWQLRILNLSPSSVRPSQKIFFFLSLTNFKSDARFYSGTSFWWKCFMADTSL